MVRGADFSSYQDDAAIERALAHGLGFAIVKLTEGSPSGHAYVNGRAAHQLQVLRAHGLRLGVYHFLDAGEGASQWAFFRRQLEKLPHHQELIICIDYEAVGTTDAEVEAFIAAGHAAGYKIGLYSSAGTSAYKKLGQAWTWVASWGRTPPPRPWVFWQFAAGTGGDPDWDEFNGDSAHLAIFWKLAAGKTSPKRYHVRFPGKPVVELGPFKTLRGAAARALAYAIRHPRRSSYTVSRSAR